MLVAFFYRFWFDRVEDAEPTKDLGRAPRDRVEGQRLEVRLAELVVDFSLQG